MTTEKKPSEAAMAMARQIEYETGNDWHENALLAVARIVDRDEDAAKREAKAIQCMVATMAAEAREMDEQRQADGAVHDAEHYRNTAVVCDVIVEAIDNGEQHKVVA